MSETKVGHCLPLYLKNGPLLSSLEDEADRALVSADERRMLDQFRERASEQAVALLEDLYSDLLLGSTGALPYRTDRRSQRRTVRENWYMDGRLYRPREKIARAYWSLVVASLRDKGPVVALLAGPQGSTSTLAFDELAMQVATTLELRSANPRTCFIGSADYDVGVVASYAELAPLSRHSSVAGAMKQRLQAFVSTYQQQFEERLGE